MELIQLETKAAENPAFQITSVELIGTGEDARFEYINPPASYKLVADPVFIDTGYLCILEDLDYIPA